uniref:C2H2-type domain-containing protein n=1 Tax=Ditylum brightwellii TaxID=49249 RepID=A0A7S4QR08_9STRA
MASPIQTHFFDNCSELQVCIYFQMVFSMMFNAFLFAFFFAGLSRCNNRGWQIIFSDKAIIRRDPHTGRYSFHVQVYDADCSHPLVEAHVRFYAIRRRFSVTGSSVTSPSSMFLQHHNLKFDPMRITNPDDELGAFMFASVPHSVSHHIDAYSPILPPSRRGAYEDGKIHIHSGFVCDSAGLNLREMDSLVGNRAGLQCTVCGETYTTTQNLVRHIRSCQFDEERDNYPIKGSHRELDVASIISDVSKDPMSHQQRNGTFPSMNEAATNGNANSEQWYDDFREYLTTSNIEILCVFEAIEPLFSGTFQSIQSYTIEDISFGGDFAPCMLYGEENTKTRGWWRNLVFNHKNDNIAARVDLDRFHEIIH